MKFKFINHEYDLPELESKGRYWNKILRVTSGCTPCSPGCDHCHEAAREHRFYPHSGATDHEDGLTKYNGKIFIEPINAVVKKCRVKKPTVYFVWNDLFHPLVSEDYILAVMLAMSQSRRNGGPHIYLLCTKRVGRMAELLNKWCKNYLTFHEGCTGRIPSHIWPMGTFCNQAEFDAGIGDLLSINASVRVLNLEPLLGKIDAGFKPGWFKENDISWLICGGETGPGARPMEPTWASRLKNQASHAGVPFFFKQWGTGRYWTDEFPAKINWEKERAVGMGYTESGRILADKGGGRMLDGHQWNEYPEVSNEQQ